VLHLLIVILGCLAITAGVATVVSHVFHGGVPQSLAIVILAFMAIVLVKDIAKP
jgi:hypothetical protein